jgi:hypothetical protein
MSTPTLLTECRDGTNGTNTCPALYVAPERELVPLDEPLAAERRVEEVVVQLVLGEVERCVVERGRIR